MSRGVIVLMAAGLALAAGEATAQTVKLGLILKSRRLTWRRRAACGAKKARHAGFSRHREERFVCLASRQVVDGLGSFDTREQFRGRVPRQHRRNPAAADESEARTTIDHEPA
jgi:hypothetical protein